MAHPSDRFDAAYFERFYEQRRTRIYGPGRAAHLVRSVVEMIAWQGGTLDSVLDVGAGPGYWRDWFRRHRPDVRYRSTDVSAHACKAYGHERRNIVTFRDKETYDLVVCQGVFPYLADAECALAIDNIANMCRGFLYFEAVTERDLAIACDRDKTDTSMLARPAAFYRALLQPHFLPLGLGLHYSRGGPLLFFELEQA